MKTLNRFAYIGASPNDIVWSQEFNVVAKWGVLIIVARKTYYSKNTLRLFLNYVSKTVTTEGAGLPFNNENVIDL